MHTTVLYHANCPDGYAAMFACWQHFKDEAQYLPVFYGQPCPEIPKDHTVYIVDFSYDYDTLWQLHMAHEHLVLLDHHKSAQEDLQLLQTQIAGLYEPGEFDICFDLTESGASLTWKYLHFGADPACSPDPHGLEYTMPTFFKYVRDRDLWQFALPDSKPISLAYWMIDKDPLSIEQFAQTLDEGEGYHRIVTEGTAMQRYADSLVKEQAARALRMTLAGYEVPVVNTTTLFSEVGDYLCQQNPDDPFVAYYFDRNDQRQWGLRSRFGFDCSIIAKQFGGGGHPGAAGFVTEKGWLP